MAHKAIKTGKDSRGRKLALADLGNGSFNVFVLCSNYAGHVRGGIAHTWRLKSGLQQMTLEAAEALFARHNRGAS